MNAMLLVSATPTHVLLLAAKTTLPVLENLPTAGEFDRSLGYSSFQQKEVFESWLYRNNPVETKFPSKLNESADGSYCFGRKRNAQSFLQ